jgi:hypothetical protein
MLLSKETLNGGFAFYKCTLFILIESKIYFKVTGSIPDEVIGFFN